MAQVKMREGVGMIKLCDKLIKEQDAELQKINKRMEKDLKLSITRGKTGNQRGAMLGIKSLNRAKTQADTLKQVKTYLQETKAETLAILNKGKKNPAEMELALNAEKIKAQVKKIKKEADLRASASTITASSDLDSEAFLRDLLQGDGGEAYLKTCYAN